ncbi:TolC family protein [Labilibacter marinus]|uniref:TolC family protein n=1 Tax=Labilibacter marinus TaxID=1477105 RepID=UPI00094F67CE|nr:TolC family protein [Labilibacter marinus]
MYTQKLLILTLLANLMIIPPIWAQTTSEGNVFTLQQIIELADQNNSTILKSIADVKSAQADNQQANAMYLPSVELSNTFYSTTDPLNAFGFKLQQAIVTQADFNPDLLNNPGTVNNFHTQIKVEQPIINVDAWLGKSAASKTVKAIELKSEYTKAHIHFILKQTYYALQLAQNRKSVIEKAYKASEAYLSMAQDNLEQGYMKDADVLAIKVRTLELDAQLKSTDNQEKSIQESLNFLIGRDISLPIQLADSIQQVSYSNTSFNAVNNRADVMAMQYGMEAHELMKKSNSFSFAPRINAFGMYNMYDADFGGFDSNSWMVGVNLQWKIFNGGKNLGKISKSKAEYSKAQISYHEYLDKGNMELMQAQRDILVNQSQILTYKTAAEQAQESLRIRANRYKEGMERTSDLLMAEAKSAESKLMHLNALYNYNVSVFKYELLSSETSK